MASAKFYYNIINNHEKQQQRSDIVDINLFQRNILSLYTYITVSTNCGDVYKHITELIVNFIKCIYYILLYMRNNPDRNE